MQNIPENIRILLDEDAVIVQLLIQLGFYQDFMWDVSDACNHTNARET